MNKTEVVRFKKYSPASLLALRNHKIEITGESGDTIGDDCVSPDEEEFAQSEFFSPFREPCQRLLNRVLPLSLH